MNRYVTEQVTVGGSVKLISVNIPGLNLQLVQKDDGTLDALGGKGKSLETIMIGARAHVHSVLIEMSGFTKDDLMMKSYYDLMGYIDELVAKHNRKSKTPLTVRRTNV
jgi:hypothetical protein